MKDDKYWAVLNAAVRLEVTKGHLLWTLSDLSRASGVGRGLIYHYFGKTKDSIITEALKLIADEVFGLSPARLEMWKEGRVADSVIASRSMLEHAPYLREFYIHWRGVADSEICRALVAVEARYLTKIRGLAKSLSLEEARAVFAVLFGLVMAPEISSKTIAAVVERTGIVSK